MKFKLIDLILSVMILYSLCCEITTANRYSSSRYYTSYACQDSILELECRDRHVIHLIRANYGRNSATVCNDNGRTDFDVNCRSSKSHNIVWGRCNQKHNCSIEASTGLFDDFCPGTVKYLEVAYSCVPEKSRTVTPSITIYPDVASTTPLTTDVGNAPSCEPITTRNLVWNRTRAGDVETLPCPNGAIGFAHWGCVARNADSAGRSSETPDLSECRSPWWNTIESRISAGESFTKIVEDISRATENNILYGGDLLYTAKIIDILIQNISQDIRTFPDPRIREKLLKDFLYNIVVAVNNWDEAAHLPSWQDLYDAERIRVANSLHKSLKDISFLLTKHTNGKINVDHCLKNILLEVQTLQRINLADQTFPQVTNCPLQITNSIQLSKSALLKNSQADFIPVVYIFYNNLLPIAIPSRNGSERIINSKIFSVTLDKKNDLKLEEPALINFQHLRIENFANPVCVSWDYSANNWSEEGCSLISTNQTHSTCSCNHLTFFTLLADGKSTQ